MTTEQTKHKDHQESASAQKQIREAEETSDHPAMFCHRDQARTTIIVSATPPASSHFATEIHSTPIAVSGVRFATRTSVSAANPLPRMMPSAAITLATPMLRHLAGEASLAAGTNPAISPISPLPTAQFQEKPNVKPSAASVPAAPTKNPATGPSKMPARTGTTTPGRKFRLCRA